MLLLALCTGTAAPVLAQNTEFSLHATSGYFGYRGASAASSSAIIVSDVAQIPSYTNSPYGQRFTLSYGGAGQVQRVTAHNLVLGAQVGYEWLRSRVKVTEVYTGRGLPTSVTGHTELINRFVNTHLFLGRRFTVKSVSLDATLGPELGWRRNTREKGEASGSNVFIRTDLERNSYADLDVRGRANLTAYYRQLGLSVGYSYGLTDYKRNYVGGVNDLTSRMLRVGAVYRLN